MTINQPAARQGPFQDAAPGPPHTRWVRSLLQNHLPDTPPPQTAPGQRGRGGGAGPSIKARTWQPGGLCQQAERERANKDSQGFFQLG